MSGNTLGFLLSLIHLFEESNLSVWVFGGWAEEIWQIIPGRMHNDIDFLYPATTFEQIDSFIAHTNVFQEIPAKQFSHKRAILYQDVVIEFLLVQGADGKYFTDFSQADIVWRGPLMCLITTQTSLFTLFRSQVNRRSIHIAKTMKRWTRHIKISWQLPCR